MLYHPEVYWPEAVAAQVQRLGLLTLALLQGHAAERAAQKGITVPATVNVPDTYCFEAETDASGRLSKVALRMPHDAKRDLAIVLRPTHGGRWKVITAWPNSRTDTHRTLDRAKYARR